MPNIVFVTWDGGGNLPPAIGIAAELQRRGDTRPGSRARTAAQHNRRRRAAVRAVHPACPVLQCRAKVKPPLVHLHDSFGA